MGKYPDLRRFACLGCYCVSRGNRCARCAGSRVARGRPADGSSCVAPEPRVTGVTDIVMVMLRSDSNALRRLVASLVCLSHVGVRMTPAPSTSLAAPLPGMACPFSSCRPGTEASFPAPNGTTARRLRPRHLDSLRVLYPGGGLGRELGETGQACWPSHCGYPNSSGFLMRRHESDTP
jgi:hypothetical protein